MQYIVIKNHASIIHNGMALVGEVIDVPDRIGKELQQKGFVKPFTGRVTKEDKNFAKLVKAEIEHDAGQMFFVKQGNKVIDRLPKKKAQKLADEINNEI